MSAHDYLVFGAPRIEADEIDEVVKCLQSGWIGTGPRVAEFEKNFASYKSAEFSAAVNSCTAALHLSLIASGIKDGDEVITTPMTFCATVNAIIHAGGVPVLADVDPETQNIDPDNIESKITEKTKAILVVHFAGRPCDMDRITELAARYQLKVIEDCAHAIESEYKGQKVGGIGDFGCFSFYVTKNIVTAEGGMVLCRSSEDISRIKVLALHGMSCDAWKRFSDSGYKHYEVVECGYKYNMTDMQASLGLRQLEKITSYHARRSEIWQYYCQELSELPVVLPALVPNDIKHAYHLFTVAVGKERCGMSRDNFVVGMHKKGIGTGVHYLSLASHPYYKDRYGWRPEYWPNAERIGNETVSLPLSAKLSDSDVERVVATVKNVLK